ncbi:MAG: hypothetical protein IJ862_04945, partial [Selenomonadaceae bacterium]|nr:hypothetical protein [Selenomonadaceae bacterium]
YSSGDGNDVITDYSAQDKLRISGTYSTLNSGNDVVVSVGSGKVTLKNAKSVALNINTNINSSNYEDRWFLDSGDDYTVSDVSTVLKNNVDKTDLNCNYDTQVQLDQVNKMTSNIVELSTVSTQKNKI